MTKGKIYLTIIILIGIIVRAGFLITSDLDSDQAIFGLQGRHILMGEFPIFSWGTAYIGTFQSYLDAVAFYVFDSSRLVLNGVTTFLSIFFILVMYLSGKEIFGEKGGLLSAALIAIGPAYLTFHGAWARHGYMETLLFGSLILLITLRLSKTENQNDRRRLMMLLGFVSGIGFWSDFLIIVYFPACGLYLLFKDRRFFKKETFLTVPSFLSGSLPVWIYNLKHHFASLEILETGEKVSFLKNFKDAILIGMPEIIGAKTVEDTVIYGFFYILSAIYLFSFVLLIISGIKDLIKREFRVQGSEFKEKRFIEIKGIGLVLLFFLSFLIIYSASSFGISILGTIRYMLPLYSVIPFLILLLLLRIKDYPKPLVVGVAVFVLFVNLYGNLRSYAFLKNDELRNYNEEKRFKKELFDFMKSKGILHAYVVNYWLGPLLTFDSKEGIIFAQPVDDRYHAYTERIDRASRYAYLIGTDMEESYEESLKRLKAGYEKNLFGNYVLFHSIIPPSMGFQIIPTDGWSATSSRDISYIKNAYDRDITTRAASPMPQMPGMYYEVDMGNTYMINKISLIPGIPTNAPRECIIELSRDGVAWRNIVTVKGFIDLYWENERLKVGSTGRLMAVFEPVPARFVRITITTGDPVYYWSIAEIFIYQEGKKEERVNLNFDKGLLYEKEGRLAEAINEYKKALKVEPDEEAYNRIGLIYYNLHMLETYYPYKIGTIFEEAGLWEEAVKEYVYVTEMLKGSSIKSIYTHLRNCYTRLNDEVRSKELDDRLLREFLPGKPMNINYGGKILFLGYDIDKIKVKRGESLRITYYWEGLRKMDKDYAVFVHFKPVLTLNQAQKKELMFQHDHRPLEEKQYKRSYKTNEWPEGEKIKEGYGISIPEEIEPGLYKITIGIWDPEGDKRLRVKGKEERDEVEIGQIEVL